MAHPLDRFIRRWKYIPVGMLGQNTLDLRAGSVLILVGNQYSGVDYQLQRLYASHPRRLKPVRTYTNRPVSSAEAAWYKSLDVSVLHTFSFGDLLTFYGVAEERYYVHVREIRAALKPLGSVALIGMTAEGYERWVSRIPRVDILFRVLPLKPDNEGTFAERLVQDYGVSPHEARSITDRTIQDSSIPPSPYDLSSSSESQIRIRGPRDEGILRLVKKLLSA